MSKIAVARQPIYDPGLKVQGYEILFRGAVGDVTADFQNADVATASVMLHSFLDIGIERIVGSHRAFINCTRPFIVGDLLHPLAPEKFVIEVQDDVHADTELIHGLRALSDHGFRVALDGYVHDGPLTPLLDVADLVKLDCPTLGVEGVQRHVKALEEWGRAIVVQRIETKETFEQLGDLGVDYFQGFFLMKPQLIAGRQVPANRLALLRVLAQVNDPNTGLEELGRVIEQDVGLAYALLRHVNSVLFGLPRRVDELREVAMLLGLDRIRSLASLLLLTQIDDKPKDVLSVALIRAKMCELLANGEDGLAKPIYFSTGLFSTLDALLEAPLQRVLDRLPLVPEINAALLGENESRLRRCLECVLAYESGDWDKAKRIEIPFDQVGGAYLSALDFATGVDGQIGVGAA